MCLRKNVRATEDFRTKNKNKKKITVWKLCNVQGDGTVTNLYASLVGYHEIKAGWVKSDRAFLLNDAYDYKMYGEINRGIHVFMTRKQTRDYKREWHRDDKSTKKIFKCEADINDLVACGGITTRSTDQAVFMKIHITKKEFVKGKKGRNN